MPKSIAELVEILNATISGLPKVTVKQMFGCHAAWADGNVFALVWKHGRIGVKLPEEAAYEALIKTSGSDPWKAGPMQMAHWVLVPEVYHAKPAEIKKWVTKAHGLCIKLEKKPNKKQKNKKDEKKPKAKKAK